MPVGEEEEEPLDLYALAVDQQLLQLPGTERAQALHQHIGLVEALVVRKLVQQFEDRPFRAGRSLAILV